MGVSTELIEQLRDDSFNLFKGNLVSEPSYRLSISVGKKLNRTGKERKGKERKREEDRKQRFRSVYTFPTYIPNAILDSGKLIGSICLFKVPLYVAWLTGSGSEDGRGLVRNPTIVCRRSIRQRGLEEMVQGMVLRAISFDL